MSAEATATPATPAAEPAKAAPAVPPAAAPPTVQLSIEEFQALQGFKTQFSELQKANQTALEAKENERIKALAEKGKVEEAFEASNKLHLDKLTAETQRYAELERQVFAERKTATIAQALAGRQFVSPDAAEQVQAILDSKVEVYRDANGKLTVVDKVTRQPATDILRASLDSPAFAHFLAATNTQGGAGQQGHRAAAVKDEAKPGSLEAIASGFLAAQSQWPSIGLTPVRK